MIFGSKTGVSLPSNSLPNSSYGWHSREICLKLLGNERSFSGFGRAIMRNFHQILGMRLVSTHRLNSSSNHFLACWPKFFSFSSKMPSNPIALSFFKAAMPFGANVRVNNLKLHLVEKYLSQENALMHLQLNLLSCFSKVCCEKFFWTNHASVILK